LIGGEEADGGSFFFFLGKSDFVETAVESADYLAGGGSICFAATERLDILPSRARPLVFLGSVLLYRDLRLSFTHCSIILLILLQNLHHLSMTIHV